jgi:hypothetical protein
MSTDPFALIAKAAMDRLLAELFAHNPQRDSYSPRHQEYSGEALRDMKERSL